MKKLIVLAAASLITPAALAAPIYIIEDLGLVNPGDSASQGLGISPGGVAVGRGLGNPSQAFFANPGSALTALPNLDGKPFGAANGANDSGLVAGTGAETFFGSGAVPLLWTNGSVMQLPVGGLGAGRANDVNGSGVAVGSIGGGVQEIGAYWDQGTLNTISATTPEGVTMQTAFRVNDAGFAVGSGLDPNVLSRTAGVMYDINSGALTEIPALAGDNGTIAFDISENGFVVGSSTFNQSGSTPFIWSELTGSVEIPLTGGVSTAIARGVNSSGWVVGIGSGQFAVPFLYDGDQSYRLQDLLPTGTDWDISMNTSSSALGISEDGTIVGTGVINGEIHAYRMILIPTPGTAALLGIGGLAMMRRRR